MLLLLLGCKPQVAPPAETETFLVNHLGYARRQENTVVGFNLDGIDSDDNDPMGCFHPDLKDPNGNQGIDNSLSELMPELDGTEAGDIEPLFNEGVKDGLLLILLQRKFEDEKEYIRLIYGSHPPLLSSDGTILDGQSFSIDSSLEQSSWVEASWYEQDEAIFQIDSIYLQSEIMAIELNYTLHDAHIRIPKERNSALLSGAVLGASMSLDDAMQLTFWDEVGLTEHLQYLLHTQADLNPDASGRCQRISLALELGLISAHLYEDQ
ncbi:MAG: hypothetical protein CMK59_12485 [Proteobacteria bacterium]|nr:hypothetical protein [Pseudomonadota bacterium]